MVVVVKEMLALLILLTHKTDIRSLINWFPVQVQWQYQNYIQLASEQYVQLLPLLEVAFWNVSFLHIAQKTAHTRFPP